MMRPLRVPFLGLAAALAAAGLTAGTAAASGPGPVGSAGCAGYSCWGQVLGDQTPTSSTGQSGNTVPPPPPPQCWYGPQHYKAATMYQILRAYGKSGPPAPYSNGWNAAEITQLYKQHAKGGWYAAEGYPTPSGQACMDKLDPYYKWVPAGSPVPQPGIGQGDLAQLALSSLTLPEPAVHPNPATRSIVRLPTFIKVNDRYDPQVHGGVIAISPGLDGTQVTVVVAEKSVSISVPAGTGATVYTRGCGPGGSRETRQQMNQAGVGTVPDCGLVFRQASSSAPFQVTVTQTWAATAYAGPYVPGKTGNLLPGGDQVLHSPPTTVQIPVQEIQSVNGTG